MQDFVSYGKILKISFRAYIFERPFLRGLFLEGLRYNRRDLSMEANVHFKIDWASLILGRKFTIFLCFTLYLRAISKYKHPGRAYIWRGGFYRGVFALRVSGPILGGAYFRNFTVTAINNIRRTSIQARIKNISIGWKCPYYACPRLCWRMNLRNLKSC